jgi:hypothetical protein
LDKFSLSFILRGKRKFGFTKRNRAGLKASSGVGSNEMLCCLESPCSGVIKMGCATDKGYRAFRALRSVAFGEPTIAEDIVSRSSCASSPHDLGGELEEIVLGKKRKRYFLG